MTFTLAHYEKKEGVSEAMKTHTTVHEYTVVVSQHMLFSVLNNKATLNKKTQLTEK